MVYNQSLCRKFRCSLFFFLIPRCGTKFQRGGVSRKGIFRYTLTMETGLSPLFPLKKEDPFMTEMEFAERLKRFRKAKNLTQQELAD